MTPNTALVEQVAERLIADLAEALHAGEEARGLIRPLVAEAIRQAVESHRGQICWKARRKLGPCDE